MLQDRQPTEAARLRLFHECNVTESRGEIKKERELDSYFTFRPVCSLRNSLSDSLDRDRHIEQLGFLKCWKHLGEYKHTTQQNT